MSKRLLTILFSLIIILPGAVNACCGFGDDSSSDSFGTGNSWGSSFSGFGHGDSSPRFDDEVLYQIAVSSQIAGQVLSNQAIEQYDDNEGKAKTQIGQGCMKNASQVAKNFGDADEIYNMSIRNCLAAGMISYSEAAQLVSEGEALSGKRYLPKTVGSSPIGRGHREWLWRDSLGFSSFGYSNKSSNFYGIPGIGGSYSNSELPSSSYYSSNSSLPYQVRPSRYSSNSSLPYQVRASRVFAGPGQYPPKSFSAYGIVAFTSTPVKYDRERFLMICAAYVAALPHARNLNLSLKDQMVTVWPVKEKSLADELNKIVWGACDTAVDNYDLVVSRQAIKEAQRAGVTLSGRGPYLLAWSPGLTKGEQDVLVLLSDLSGLTTYQDVKDVFVQWAEDIEQNPELWRHGWNLEMVRQLIRIWADKYGPKILSLVTGKP